MDKEDLKKEYDEFKKLKFPDSPAEDGLSNLFAELVLFDGYIAGLVSSYLKSNKSDFDLIFMDYNFNKLLKTVDGDSNYVKDMVERKKHLDNLIKIITEIEGIYYIDDIITGLSQYSPFNIQQETIQKILAIDNFNYSLLIHPWGHMDCWDNCAEVFTKITFDKLEPHISRLPEWLHDMDWPGAKIIYNLLKSLPRERTGLYINKAIERAVKTKDKKWEENLRNI